MLDVLLVLPPLKDYSKSRVFLIDNASFEIDEPLGLCYIAAELERFNYKVKILDMNLLKLSYSDYIDYLKRANPKIVGFSLVTINYDFAKELAKLTKEFNENIIVIAGGIHANLFPLNVIKEPNFDIIIIGEGEYTTRELCEYFIDGTHKIEEIKGIYYKDKNGKIRKTKIRPLEENLDNFAFPAKHLIIGNEHSRLQYFSAASKYNPTTAIVTHRGCPYQCTFCSRLFKKPRFRSAENILQEIEYIQDVYKIKDIQFRDDTFNLRKRATMELTKGMIKNQYNVVWRALARPDLLNEEMAKTFKRAGCYLLSLGAESGSDRILKKLRKGYSTQQVRKAFSLAKKYDIQTHAYFIMGVPGETINDIGKTIAFIKELKPLFINIQIYSPIPGTELYDYVSKHNLIDPKMTNEKLRGLFRPFVKLEHFTPRQITNIRRMSIFRHYLDLDYISYLGKEIIKEPKRYIRNIFQLIKFWSS